MAQLENLIFEVERRVSLFKPTTTMTDGSLLGYNGDPNSVSSGGTAGEYLIYAAPLGTSYQQSNGTMWYKRTMPNDWALFSSSTGTTNITVDTTGLLSLSGGTISGDLTVSGNTNLNGNLNVSGNTVLQNLTVSGGSISGDGSNIYNLTIGSVSGLTDFINTTNSKIDNIVGTSSGMTNLFEITDDYNNQVFYIDENGTTIIDGNLVINKTIKINSFTVTGLTELTLLFRIDMDLNDVMFMDYKIYEELSHACRFGTVRYGWMDGIVGSNENSISDFNGDTTNFQFAHEVLDNYISIKAIVTAGSWTIKGSIRLL